MKKSLIALSMSLLAASGLQADYYDGSVSTETETNTRKNACGPSCCKPCCKPEPKKCIDCECYVPAWYDLQCDWGLFLTVDFLYWYARECNLPYAARVLGQSGFSNLPDQVVASPKSYEHLNTKWAPGVRVGLGWNLPCDGWDLYFTWTGYWNEKKGSSSVDEFATVMPAVGAEALQNLWVYPQGLAGTGPYSSQVSAKWDFKFNRFDLVMGKRYWLSKSFTLRPFAGLAGIWTETEWTVTSRPRTFDTLDDPVQNYTTASTSKQINDNWGAGLTAGFEPTFQFSECFALYADLGMALVWGEQRHKQTGTFLYQENTSIGNGVLDYSFNEKDSYYCMMQLLDLGIGLRWESYWCDRQYHFALDLGWEHHTIFNLNQSRIIGAASNIDASGNIAPIAHSFFANDVNMGGLVVRARFDF